MHVCETDTNEEQFAASFVALDCVIDRFLGSLLPVEMSIDRDAALQLLLCHTLGRAATIQLHKNFKHMDGLTESKDVVASKAASAALDGVDFAQLAFVDPIFAVSYFLLHFQALCILTMHGLDPVVDYCSSSHQRDGSVTSSVDWG